MGGDGAKKFCSQCKALVLELDLNQLTDRKSEKFEYVCKPCMDLLKGALMTPTPEKDKGKASSSASASASEDKKKNSLGQNLLTSTYVGEISSRTVRIDVGILYADEERDFLLSVNVPVGDSSNETTLFNVRCTYKDPVSEVIKAPEGKEVRIQRPEVVRESVVSIEVDRQRNRLQAAEAMAASRRAAEQGDLANVVEHVPLAQFQYHRSCKHPEVGDGGACLWASWVH